MISYRTTSSCRLGFEARSRTWSNGFDHCGSLLQTNFTKTYKQPTAQTVRTVPNGNEDSMVKTAIVLTILTEFPEEWPGRRLSHWPNVLKDVISLLMRFFDNSSQVSLGSRCEFCFAYHDRVLMSLNDHLSNRLECCFYSCK